ncbi:nitrous oxide reductase family maturation protein NosD [Varunaivibrio sulfuroxidans]|nr:nitrous oxide reductase family maturation protein NosD [Varunaivibrio sulfuroxidans]WES31558.1 nitrous oxide reductase family maturation protein NosD [Varunaivibrio sulfuroxidans]
MSFMIVVATGLLCAWAGLVLASPAASAATRLVAPGPDALRRAIAAAAPGDRLELQSGTFHGPVVVDKPLTLEGENDSVIDGGGKGRVITISAPHVTVRGVTIINSGIRLDIEDAGIYVLATANDALIENNRFRHNLTGVFLKGPKAAVVRNNDVVGRKDLRMNERGNAFHIWNSPGSVIENNTVRYGRDGIFVTTSKDNIFRGNTFRDLRFAVHYMYTNASEVSHNLSTGNHIGYAIMFSQNLKIEDNVSRDDRDRAFLFNYANYSLVDGNFADGGAKKCVFIYNANHNVFRDNIFSGCTIGIHFTAGSEDNEMVGNAFINNRTQVKYVGTRHLEWSVAGRGNYWSDNLAFDLDGDHIADRPYHPNDMIDKVMWRHPLAKLLLNSPAVQVLRWAQSEFPSLRPGGVVDSAPLMSPPKRRQYKGARS